jgi:acyl-CoA hydrolase
VARAIFNAGIQMIVQFVAVSPDGRRFSLSCNPDLTLDLVDLHRQSAKPLLVVGVVHPDMPFLGGDAEVPADFFDAVLISDEIQHLLFAPPRVPVDPEEYLIGLHASRLVRDDGTLQIGIGALSDAVVYALLLRHQQNGVYRSLLRRSAPTPSSLEEARAAEPAIETFSDPFGVGLYGTSELVMDGFMHLRKAGILTRQIFDGDELKKRYLHGAFFLGSKAFYAWLRTLSEEDYAGFSMTRVSKVNDLYDPHELSLRRQRKNARFLNTCMNVTLLGGAASDTLEDGQVVSGVGGQYNFVAMSQELPDSHSVLMLRSTHIQNGKRVSNIVYGHGQLTIPRHLRDVIVTEYGIAAVRGQCDEVTIQRILNITDSEFQPALLRMAKANGKLAKDYEIPLWARNNTPARVQNFFADAGSTNLFPAFPFGSDFTPVEERLQAALLKLKRSRPLELLRMFCSGLTVDEREFSAELSRMNLQNWFYKKLLLGSLS